MLNNFYFQKQYKVLTIFNTKKLAKFSFLNISSENFKHMGTQK